MEKGEKMRLIDADNIKIPADAPYKASVKRVIAQQPTAYDVDKVVEQIENHKTYIYRGNDIVGERHGITREEAIEIVKAGGIND